MNAVRVRFAPSPTGALHIGGLRTPLYNYLFAKKNKGTFVLRIEDTDQARLVPGALDELLRTLETMGIAYDEGPVLIQRTKNKEQGTDFENQSKIEEKGSHGPYIQSKRLDVYQKFADELLTAGKAYRCFCSPERLAKLREEQIKMKQAPRYGKHCLS